MDHADFANETEEIAALEQAIVQAEMEYTLTNLDPHFCELRILTCRHCGSPGHVHSFTAGCDCVWFQVRCERGDCVYGAKVSREQFGPRSRSPREAIEYWNNNITEVSR